MKQNSPKKSVPPKEDDLLVKSIVHADRSGGNPDRVESGYIARTLPALESQTFEHSLEDDPLYLAHLHEVRDAVAAMTTPEKLDALGDRLRREVDEALTNMFAKPEVVPSNVVAGPVWDTGKNVIEVCFRPVAKVRGADKINRTETLHGPPGLLDSEGKVYPVRLSERETEQGDVWIAAEADAALDGRILHLRGKSEIVLSLQLERGKAFRLLALSWNDYADFCPPPNTDRVYGWE